MTRMMQWILLAGVLFLIAPESLPAQEKILQGQSVGSAGQTGGNADDPQQIQLQKLQDERSLKQMEARYKTAKYYALLSVIAFAITILGIFAIITLVFFVRAREERRRHALIGQFLEKGQEVPRELLAGRVVGAVLTSEQRASFIRYRDLRIGTGLLCLGLGIGLALCLWSGTLRYAAWCLIILFLSAGFYVNALFFSGKSDYSRKRESDA